MVQATYPFQAVIYVLAKQLTKLIREDDTYKPKGNQSDHFMAIMLMSSDHLPASQGK